MSIVIGASAVPVAAVSGDTSGATQPGHTLAEVFVPRLDELKSKTRVPILLPDDLPNPINDAKEVVIRATGSQYDVGLYYRLDHGNTGFAAAFFGDAEPKYDPRELPDVGHVSLADGVQGYFRPVRCGGSCAPANLWWKIGDVLYQLQLKLRSTTDEQKQKDMLSSVADSAILAGAR